MKEFLIIFVFVFFFCIRIDYFGVYDGGKKYSVSSFYGVFRVIGFRSYLKVIEVREEGVLVVNVCADA